MKYRVRVYRLLEQSGFIDVEADSERAAADQVGRLIEEGPEGTGEDDPSIMWDEPGDFEVSQSAEVAFVSPFVDVPKDGEHQSEGADDTCPF
jgi:hypothetical protein